MMIRFCSKTVKTVQHHVCFFLAASMIWACNGNIDTTNSAPPNTSLASGTVSFAVEWIDNSHGRVSNASPSGDVCVDYAIDTIVIEVHDATGAVVNSLNRDCADHQATISKVPTGSGLWLSLNGMVAGTAYWSGQSAAFEVAENQTTDAGTVSMHYVGEDSVRPQVQTASPVDGAVNVSLDAKVTATFDEDVVAASVVPAISVSDGTTPLAGTVAYDVNTRTATFTPDADLPESTVLTALVGASVEDQAGNQMAGDVAWQFTSTSIDAPSATTLAATAVTEAGATLNGEVNPNGLATTCWFEYGTDTSYGQSTAVVDMGAGRDAQSVSADIGGLSPYTDYHFRLVAENAGGIGNGTDAALKTDAIWARTYGTAEDDSGYQNSIRPTRDGGYIIAAHTKSFGAGDFDIWILKLDATGTVEWEKTFGGLKQDFPASVQQTAEGGYVVAGHTLNFGEGGYDYWVLKLTADGDTDWSRTYGGADYDFAESMRQTADGGFIIAGESQSFGAGKADAWILKLNADGTIGWQKSYGGSEWDSAYSVRQAADKSFIVAGRTESFALGSFDMWLMKLNSDGSIAWQKTYGGTANDYCKTAVPTADGGFIAAGYTHSFGAGASGGDIWIVKLAEDGAVQWQSTYGGAYGDSIASIGQTSDGGYIVAASTQNFSDDLNDDIWIFKLKANGAIEWEKTYGGPEGDHAGSLRQTVDGGYIVLGGTHSYGAGGTSWGDLWVMKLGQGGTLGCGLGVDSSALRLTPDAVGIDTDVTIKNTTVTSGWDTISGQDTTATVARQCP